MIITNARIFDGRRFVKANTVEARGGLISGVYYSRVKPAGSIDLKGRILSPGLIDLHVHASGKRDFIDAKTPADVMKIKSSLAKAGTTSFLLTTLFDRKRKYPAEYSAGTEGLYFEGPYINKVKKGAIPGKYVDNNYSLQKVLAAAKNIKMMVVSPELPGAIRLIRRLKKHGIIPSIGHTLAGRRETVAAIRAGASHVTHYFNTMDKEGERYEGMQKALLRHKNVTLEIIADGEHVYPEYLRKFYRLFGRDRIVLITDATGSSKKYNKGIRAGSHLHLLEMVRRMRRFCGLGIEPVLQMATCNPAKVLGIPAGRIAPGCRAEFVVLDKRLRLRSVIV